MFCLQPHQFIVLFAHQSHPSLTSSEGSPTFDHANANFSVFNYGPYKEGISKEMNNDNDLNLHSMPKLLGWLTFQMTV